MEYKQKYPVIIQGAEPGPTSVILAGIHGNEHAGITAFESVIPGIKIERGTVIFELGNVEAIARDERGDKPNNMNRLLRNEEDLSEAEKGSYAFPRSRYLMSLIANADALLDIHTTKNGDCRMIICEKGSLAVAEMLPFELVCTGFNAFEPGATDGFMSTLGKTGICVECGQHDDPKAPELAIQSIAEFLVAMDHNQGRVSVLQQRKMEIFYLYHSSTDSFTFVKKFSEFEKVTRGMLIGHDGDEPVHAVADSFIVFPVVRHAVGEECFLLAKEIEE